MKKKIMIIAVSLVFVASAMWIQIYNGSDFIDASFSCFICVAVGIGAYFGLTRK